jgi:hypothetical protein
MTLLAISQATVKSFDNIVSHWALYSELGRDSELDLGPAGLGSIRYEQAGPDYKLVSSRPVCNTTPRGVYISSFCVVGCPLSPMHPSSSHDINTLKCILSKQSSWND